MPTDVAGAVNHRARWSMLRSLRIAGLAMCLLVGTSLIAMWVRSYYREDGLCWGITEKRGFFVFSAQGKVSVHLLQMGGDTQISKWFAASYPPGDAFWLLTRDELASTTLGMYLLSHTSGTFVLIVPFWLLLTLTGCVATLLYRKRFGLRALLVGMTLFAVLLGILASSGSNPLPPHKDEASDSALNQW